MEPPEGHAQRDPWDPESTRTRETRPPITECGAEVIDWLQPWKTGAFEVPSNVLRLQHSARPRSSRPHGLVPAGGPAAAEIRASHVSSDGSSSRGAGVCAGGDVKSAALPSRPPSVRERLRLETQSRLSQLLIAFPALTL